MRKLTANHLQNYGFEKHVVPDNDGDNSVWYINEKGISIYAGLEGWEDTFCFATYIKGDGSFKGGFVIQTPEQLNELVHALTQKYIF